MPHQPIRFEVIMNTASNQWCLASGLHVVSSSATWTETVAAFVRQITAPTVREASLALLCRAEGYEGTQPSYAADMRAAALLAMDDTGETARLKRIGRATGSALRIAWGTAASAIEALREWLAAAIESQRQRQFWAELHLLDGAALRDLGLDRSELDSFAAEAARTAARTRRRLASRAICAS
jgi:uncharacterized protein YjiS (DUF1127 family)